MSVLFVLIPLGLVLLALAIAAFFWAVGSGPFDDLDSPGWTVLDDETRRQPPQGDAPAAEDDASRTTEPPP